HAQGFPAHPGDGRDRRPRPGRAQRERLRGASPACPGQPLSPGRPPAEGTIVRYRRLRPLLASGRLALSLVCAVAAVLAAGLAFLSGAVALGSTACGT